MITQSNRPIAFFSQKLTDPQTRYSITEIELLAIVETFKEFKGMLMGQTIKVYTDHKNLIQYALGSTSDRIYRWRLVLEEYGPEIIYIEGIHNIVADAISRLDYNPSVNPPFEFNLATMGLNKKKDHIKWKTVSKLYGCYVTMSEQLEKQMSHMSFRHGFCEWQ